MSNIIKDLQILIQRNFDAEKVIGSNVKLQFSFDTLNRAIETIQSLQEENERVMEGLHQIRILEDSYDPEITVLSQIFDIVYKLENEVKDD